MYHDVRMHRNKSFGQVKYTNEDANVIWLGDSSLSQVGDNANVVRLGGTPLPQERLPQKPFNTERSIETRRRRFLQSDIDIDASQGFSSREPDPYSNDLDEHLNRLILRPVDAPTPRHSLRSASIASSVADAWVENMPGRKPRHTASFPEAKAVFHHEMRYSPWRDGHSQQLRAANLEMSGYKLFLEERELHDPDLGRDVWKDILDDDERQMYARRARGMMEHKKFAWNEPLGAREAAELDVEKTSDDGSKRFAASEELSKHLAEFRAAHDKQTKAYELELRKVMRPPSEVSSDASDSDSKESDTSEKSDLFYAVTGFKWSSPAPLRIRIERAVGLRDLDWFGGADPDSYCVCSVYRQRSGKEGRMKEVFQTDVVYATTSPIWNETKHFEGFKIGDDLEFKVMQISDKEEHVVFGKARLHCSKFIPSGFSGDIALSEESQSAAELKGNFAGRWKTQHGSPVTILQRGPKIEWQNGDITKVVCLSDNEISVDIDETTHTATLSDEKIFWSDGDVWERAIHWEGKWLSKWPSGKEAWLTVVGDGSFRLLGQPYQLDLSKQPVEFKWVTGEMQKVVEFDPTRIVWRTSHKDKRRQPRTIYWERPAGRSKGRLTLNIALLSPVGRKTPELALTKESHLKFRISSKEAFLCHLTFRRSRKVRDLKRAVFVTTNISEMEQRLFLHGARELLDNQQLSEIGLSEDSTSKSIDILLSRRTPEQVRWLQRVKKQGALFLEAPLEMRLDKDCVVAALHQEPQFIDLVEDIFLVDRHFYTAIVGAADYPFLRYAPESVQDDYGIVLKAVRANGGSLKFASRRLQAEIEIVRAAVQQNGYALRYASDELRADREIVKLAVQENGYALGYAALDEPLAPFLIKLSEDKDLITTAMKTNDMALRFAADSLFEDKEFADMVRTAREKVATLADNGGLDWNPRPEQVLSRTKRDIAPYKWDQVDAINLWTRKSPALWEEV